jgi:YD repeat-containing protein
LATVKDSATGITTTYYYDFTDRLMKYVETNDDFTHSVAYTYDGNNNLSAWTEKINGVDNTFLYEYDNWNRVSKIISDAGTKLYSYDDLDRVTETETRHNGSLVKTDSYSYNGVSGQILTHIGAPTVAPASDKRPTYNPADEFEELA